MSQRKTRALVVIASALTVIIAVSLLYIRTLAPRPAPLTPDFAPPTLSGYEADYAFLSPSVGWALLAESTEFAPSRRFWVFGTRDGARHWDLEVSGVAPYGQNAIRFNDPKHGTISFSGSSLAAYRTADAGLHWQMLGLPNGAAAITFVDPNRGWLLRWEPTDHTFQLFSTSDGGITWRERALPSHAVQFAGGGPGGLVFSPGGEGWLSDSERPGLYVTSDDAANWRRVSFPSAYANSFPQGSFFIRLLLTPHRGIVAVVMSYAAEQLAFVSFDGGQTWRQLVRPPQPATFDDLSFVDDTHWWAARRGFLFKTSDAGLNWHEFPVHPRSELWSYESAHVIDASHAWALLISAAHSTISALAMTSDGGANWNPVNVPRPS
jgi:photosystem II stability/assembly factor-like uncharacterized protein